MSSELFAFLVLSVCCLHVKWATADVVAMDPCVDKLSADIKKDALEKMEACKKKLSLADLPNGEDLEKSGFDDKCFSKCVMSEFKLFTDKNTFDDKVFEELNKKIPADKQAEIAKVWTACGESLKKTMDAEGGITDKNSCKAGAMLKHCFVQGVGKMC